MPRIVSNQSQIRDQRKVSVQDTDLNLCVLKWGKNELALAINFRGCLSKGSATRDQCEI